MADEIVLHVTEANYEDTVVRCDKPVLLAIGAPSSTSSVFLLPTQR